MTMMKVFSFLLLSLLPFYVLSPSSLIVTSVAFLIWPFIILLCASKLSPYLWRVLDRLIRPINPKGKAILITGCDLGFGYETALRLNKAGFHIFAGCLDSGGRGAVHLKRFASYPEKMEIVQLDVTNDEQIHSAYKFISARLQENNFTLWGLLNNAAIAIPGCLEFGKFEKQHLTVFNVNVFGTLKVTRAFLPLIRESQGRIVTMSSMASRHYYPYCGTYAMTKAATKSFIEYLRHEMFPFKVKVISIEPNFARTSMIAPERNTSLLEKSWEHTAEEVRQAYGSKTLQRVLPALAFTTSPVMQVDSVFNETLKAIMNAFICYEPDIHYTIMPFYFKPLLFLKPFLPEFLTFPIERFIFSKMLYNSIDEAVK